MYCVLTFKADTLRAHCEFLNANGIPTTRGGPWMPGQVKRILERHGATAKSLLKRVTTPPARVRRERPHELYVECARRQAEYDTGKWVRVMDASHVVSKNDLVRHPVHGEGQALEIHLSRILGLFIGETGGFKKDCRVCDLETFIFDFTREERQEKSRQISAELGL
jgi:hypothetical protein